MVILLKTVIKNINLNWVEEFVILLLIWNWSLLNYNSLVYNILVISCTQCCVFYFRFELALQQNEIMDVFFIDWLHLGDADDTFGSKADNHLKVKSKYNYQYVHLYSRIFCGFTFSVHSFCNIFLHISGYKNMSVSYKLHITPLMISFTNYN